MSKSKKNNTNNNNNIIEGKPIIPIYPLDTTAGTLKDLEKNSKNINSFNHQLDKCEELEKTIKFLKLKLEQKDKEIAGLTDRVTTLVNISVNKTVYNSVCNRLKETKTILETSRIKEQEYKEKYITIKRAVDNYNDKLIPNILGLLVKY